MVINSHQSQTDELLICRYCAYRPNVMILNITFKSIEQQAIYVYICKYICSLPGKLHTVSNNLETLVYVNKYKENCFLWQKKIVWCFNIEFLINKTKQWIKIFGWSIWLHVPGIWISEVQQNCISHEPLSNITGKENLLPWILAPGRTDTTQRWQCWGRWWQIQRQGHLWSPAERRTPTWSVEPL